MKGFSIPAGLVALRASRAVFITYCVLKLLDPNTALQHNTKFKSAEWNRDYDFCIIYAYTHESTAGCSCGKIKLLENK